MSDDLKFLTIFTPTYNRAYLLPNVYSSLCEQNLACFEWVIVDDGSSDNTKELVKQWISDKRIEIKFLEQTHGGKQKAHNKAVNYSRSTLFMCLDSDDILSPNATKKIFDLWKDADNGIAGIVGYKGLSLTEKIDVSIQKDIRKVCLVDLYNAGYKGETTLIYRTSILKENLYPEIPGELYFVDSYVYERIDRKYKMLFLRNILQIYEYLPDGTSYNHLRTLQLNPLSYSAYYNQSIMYANNISDKIFFCIYYIAHALLGKKRKIVIESNSPALSFLLYPLSVVYALILSFRYCFIK